MSPYITQVPDPQAWQESWDRQQEAYMPDREHRFAAMLDAVQAVADGSVTLLDLAGGTGSISLRALDRLPDADVTVLDLDPVTLAVARASLSGRATVVSADLGDPGWTAALPHRRYDAVLTATALHWIEETRLATLYSEIHGLLRPGGIFVNADRMPDDDLPGLTARLTGRADRVRDARYRAGTVLSWQDWWKRVTDDSVLGPLAAEREKLFPRADHNETLVPIGWHREALRKAGFAEVGTLWRGGADAAVVSVA
ncbi:methyltransferase [Virgisporangium aliadipatigenens]|uniref:Methyltransferase n=1 Tax=Virgisporangium aliadipatigenens TaxID=741659 RepID=A0A8J4DUR0_9ACTN|nr:class I SAM-dependent methyltransferase [Virgisporangium aliadipatigenens]GIJ50651.1 methyltransferase [Virgisporangium aliadipatigenens]